MNQIPHRRSDDGPQTGLASWRTRKITVSWALSVCAVIFLCFSLIAYSIKRNFDADNARLAAADYYTCVGSNARRADARLVALADVDSDRDIWDAIDDLFPDGIPEPARGTIFDGLDAREANINDTYQPVVCQKPPDLPAPEDT